MVRKSSIICILIFFVVQGAAFAADMNLKPKLACLPFIPLNVEAMAFAENISSLLFNCIDRTGFFETIERRKIEGSTEREGLRINNLTKDNLFKIGGEAGLDFLVYGTVKRIGNGMAVEIQLLSMRSGKIHYSETFRISDYETAGRVQKVTADIIAKAIECTQQGQNLAKGQKRLTAPAGLEVSGASSKMRLRWNVAEGSKVAGFKVFRAARETGPFVNIATCPEPSYTDGNLKVNETFCYRVKAVAANGLESDFSETVMGRTSLAPQPPILLNIVPDAKGALLVWRHRPADTTDPGLAVAGYKIYRKAAGDKDYLERARCSKDDTAYKDSGLKADIRYTYAVVSLNSDNIESEFSTPLDVTAIPAAGRLRVESVQKRRVTLKWEPSVSDAIEGYIIYRSERKEEGFNEIAAVKRSGGATYTDLAPESCKTYWYKVAAHNRERVETGTTEPVSAITEGKLPVPTGISAVGGQAKKTALYWQPAGTPSDDIRGYFIYRAEEEKGRYQKAGKVSSAKTSFFDEEKPLRDNTTYYYRVSSYDATGDNSALSEPVSATTKGLPKTPGKLKTVSGEVRKVTLTWDPNLESDIQWYEIYRGQANETTATYIGKVKGNSFVDMGLKDGVAYIYAVKAVNEDTMASPISPAVTAWTKPLPKKPAGLRVTDKDGKRLLTWEPSSEKDIRCYNVYKKGFMGVSRKLDRVETNSFRIDNLREDGELFVTAQDADGLESEGTTIVVSR